MRKLVFIGAFSAWWLLCGRPLSAANRGQQKTVWTETCVVDLLVNLVTNHISSSFCPSTQGDVMVLCNVLASFLRGSRGGILYGVGNIVGSAPIGSASEDF
jgi:hypothetical protein